MVRVVTDDDIGLKVLYEPSPDAQGANPIPSVDIVAIHGIGAHPEDTWCKKVDAGDSSERYVNWLKDRHMLPAVVPNARIMRYGYQSQWFGDEAISQKTSTVAQRLLLSLRRKRKTYPLRPLLFIAHCFGGLVVLRTIVDASRSDTKWHGIFKSTTGMVFFGTPFQGAGGLDQTEMIRAAQSQYAEDQVQATVLNILSPGNESLIDLTTNFFETRQGEGKTHIACFFEQKSSNVGAIFRNGRIQKFVVDETSGCLNQSESTEKYSLSRDHFSMNKFGRPEEKDFQTVCEVVEKMVEQSAGLITIRDQEQRPSGHDNFRVLFRLTGLRITGNFVDRDTEMRQIEQSLLFSNTQDRRRIHVLHGLGGIGKTQLAIAYARKYQERYSAILWLNGNSRDTLVQSLATFARSIEIDGAQKSIIDTVKHGQERSEQANAVLRWLALEGNHRWLLVFDNVDRDYEAEVEDQQAYDLESFFPGSDHGSVLITTRLPHLGGFGSATKVTSVDQEQGRQILRNNVRGCLSTSEMDSVVTRLGGLPLAIVQAGRYMQETGTSCQSYLRLYETSWSTLQADVPRMHDYANGSVQTTWIISYDRIRQLDSAAAQLLQLWAYLDHQDLWFGLLTRGSQDRKDPDWLQNIVRQELSFKKVMKTLLAYSLVESHQDIESYSMHPVVHDWSIESINGGKPDLMRLALSIVGHAVPGQSESMFWVMQQRLIPHANRCVQQLHNIEEFKDIEDKDCNDAFHKFGLLYVDQDKPVEAEKMFQRALNGYEKAWELEHTSILDTVNSLGLLYLEQGKLIEAKKLLQWALVGCEKALGLKHTTTLDIVNNSGNLYRVRNKLIKAEKMYQRALEGKEEAWGLNHASTISTVENLGNLYIDQDKLVEAEQMYQRALDGYEEVYDSEHTTTLGIVNNLYCLHNRQGRFIEAEKMHQRALDEKKKIWGLEQTSTLDAVNNLGILYRKQGKLIEAEKMLQRALDGKKKAWGSKHPSTLSTTNNLASLYVDQGKLVEAEQMYQQALDEYEKAWGSEHKSTLDTAKSLSIVHELQWKKRISEC